MRYQKCTAVEAVANLEGWTVVEGRSAAERLTLMTPVVVTQITASNKTAVSGNRICDSIARPSVRCKVSFTGTRVFLPAADSVA
jgi:hypothetical protein